MCQTEKDLHIFHCAKDKCVHNTGVVDRKQEPSRRHSPGSACWRYQAAAAVSQWLHWSFRYQDHLGSGGRTAGSDRYSAYTDVSDNQPATLSQASQMAASLDHTANQQFNMDAQGLYGLVCKQAPSRTDSGSLYFLAETVAEPFG